MIDDEINTWDIIDFFMLIQTTRLTCMTLLEIESEWYEYRRMD